MFLKGVWFIIAAVLLLGHTPGLAEPYLRVSKNGVVYYHFASHESNQPRQAGKNTPKPRGEAWIQVPSSRQKQPAAAVKASLRGKSNLKPEAVSPTSTQVLMPVMSGPAEDLQVVQPYDVKRMILASTDYLFRLLTKLGSRYPLALPAYKAGLQGGLCQRDIPAGKVPQIVAPEGWKNLLKYAQEQSAALCLAIPDAFAGSGQLLYSFPVADPFSFRDTWGESRGGGTRIHRAVDIFAQEGTAVYAITAGVIDRLATIPEAGITLFLRGQDGRGYGYMHLHAYAPGVVEGKVVRAGELIGYVGHTGTQFSDPHLHLQVYADHRLCRDELLNPYSFLVQLCHGIGVTDLYQHKVARLEDMGRRVNGIQVYKRPRSAALKGSVGQFSVKDSSVLVIKNF